jgi:hypothetical protein
MGYQWAGAYFCALVTCILPACQPTRCSCPCQAQVEKAIEPLAGFKMAVRRNEPPVL